MVQAYAQQRRLNMKYRQFVLKIKMHNLKVDATSLRLEIRLYAHRVGMNTRFGTEAILTQLHSSDWLIYSELGYYARSYFRLKRRRSDFPLDYSDWNISGWDDGIYG